MIRASALRSGNEQRATFTEVSQDSIPEAVESTDALQNIVIQSVKPADEVPESVTKQAMLILDNDLILRDIIQEIRKLHDCKKETFRISLSGKAPEEKQFIVNLFYHMYGVVDTPFYDENTDTLSGHLVTSCRAERFLYGDYMEIAVYARVREIVERLAGQYQKEYEVYRNVVVSTRSGLKQNEFDILICFGGIYYVIEVKSRRDFHEYGKYVKIGNVYHIVPNRFLLVNHYLEDETCDTIQYNCEYYVSNCKGRSLEDKLTAMIENDCVGGAANV